LGKLEGGFVEVAEVEEVEDVEEVEEVVVWDKGQFLTIGAI